MRGGEGTARIHPFAATTYVGRILVTAIASTMIATIIWHKGAGFALGVLAFGLVYPHVAYSIAVHSGQSRLAGLITFYIDSFIMGIWVLMLSYALIPTLAIAVVVFSVPLLMGGVRLALPVLIPFAVVLLVGSFFVTPQFSAYNEGIPLALAIGVIMSYLTYISWLTNKFGFDLITTRKSLQAQNEKVLAQSALLESMNRVAHLVNATTDVREVMEAVQDGLRGFFAFDQMGVLFMDDAREALVVRQYMGRDASAAKRLEGLRVPLSEESSIFVTTLKARQPRYVADTAGARPHMSPSDARIYDAVPHGSIVTFPLEIDKEAMGVLAFSTQSTGVELDREDIATVGRYVAFIATAIRKAQLDEDIRRAQQEAVAANEAKSQFLANMSHELRTPMNAVIGYSEMLAEEAEEQGLTDFIDDLARIRAASKHLLGLINDVLDLAKIEARKTDLYLEPVDVAHLVDELAGTALPLAQKNGNRLEVQCAADLGEVEADAVKLRQAALNLIGNACKFTRDGTITVAARRLRDNEREWLELDVSDTGIGMTDEQLERVFQPFVQADAATTRTYGGTGLGLSITKGFCELMGGRVSATSTVGKGSCFTIRIPADAVAAPA